MPIYALLLAAVAGGGAGVVVRRWLVRGSWRLPEEQPSRSSSREAGSSRSSSREALAERRIETTHTGALPRLAWEPVALAILWPGLLAVVGRVDLPWAWPALAVLSAAGVALTSIDLAVHRLPDIFTLGSVPVVGALLAFASWREGDWQGWVTAAWAAGVALVVLLVLGLGGMGLGDVKLGVLLAGALGWFGVTVALVGLLLGFVLGGLWAGVLLLTGRASRSTRFAYGPWMLLGALAALLTMPG
ncbi:prepilin peptidase [Barrientosiimonas humi]|uniref:prepilin peptidase n=1 Tax=Barrientosiimonas humi TaxID=999931 RepID=UPI00370DA9BE